MGIREGARPETQAEIERRRVLEEKGRERLATAALSDPILIKQRLIAEQAERDREEQLLREQREALMPYTTSNEMREALNNHPMQRTSEQKRLLKPLFDRFGIFQ